MQKIGILCASDTELEPFLPHLRGCSTTEKAMLKFYAGDIDGVPVVALYSGVCKVNAALATQILIDAFGVTAVVNAGTAGGMAASVHIFDTVVAQQCAYHDVAEDILTDFHPWMPSVYFPAAPALLRAAQAVAQEWPGGAVHFGTIVTGEAFISDTADEKRADINAAHAPLAVDMETAAVAHVCYANSVPFLSVRTITDDVTHTGLAEFDENCPRASAMAKDFVLALLRALA